MNTSNPTRDKTPGSTGPKWTSLVRYFCRACAQECINHFARGCTQYQECRACHRVAQLDQDPGDLDVDVDELPGPVLGPPVEQQAVDLVCGRFQIARREREPAHGRNARQRSASEQPGTSSGVRSDRSAAQTQRYADRTLRLVQR